jgi:hypothetical protein
VREPPRFLRAPGVALAEARNPIFRTRLKHDASGPVVLLSPHLDDAVLDCWSWLTGPGEVTVVNVFAGIPRSPAPGPWDVLCGAADARVQMRARLDEDAAVLGAIGRTPVNLPLLDCEYRRLSGRYPFARIDRELTERVPSASRVLAPLGVRHPDHTLVQRYALRLLDHGLPVTLYAELPHGVLCGWPHWVTGEPRDPHLDPDSLWTDALQRIPDRDRPAPRVISLDEESAARKLESLRGYRTQFPALDLGPVGMFSKGELHRYEVFWELDEA